MGRYVDRSEVIFEVYPGAANDIAAYIALCGGLVCEQHPHREWPHDDCAGPGTLNEPPSTHCGASSPNNGGHGRCQLPLGHAARRHNNRVDRSTGVGIGIGWD